MPMSCRPRSPADCCGSTLQPGDPVVEGETVVAHMLPANPAALDVAHARASEWPRRGRQGRAARGPGRPRPRRWPTRTLAETDLERTRSLADNGLPARPRWTGREPPHAPPMRRSDCRGRHRLREADLANARALLIGFDDRDSGAIDAGDGDGIPLYAPARPAGSSRSCSKARQPWPPARRSWRSATSRTSLRSWWS